MAQRTVVLATRNAGKLREMERLLQPLGWQLRPVSDFTDEAPEETAPTFVENALIKARHAARVSGLPSLADDSGLEVDALSGKPGVRSARYAGAQASDAENNALLLQALHEVPDEARGARFVCVLAFLRHAEDPTPVLVEGLWRGRILREPAGRAGFGYDPLFFVPEQGCSSAELPAELKNRISHRARAAQALLSRLGAG